MNRVMLSAVLSLIAGLIVGIGYGLCGIRSPAPPAIALLGLLGMLAGSQLYHATPAETLAHRTPNIPKE
jgi:XapX domain-containing protein